MTGIFDHVHFYRQKGGRPFAIASHKDGKPQSQPIPVGLIVHVVPEAVYVEGCTTIFLTKPGVRFIYKGHAFPVLN